MRLTVVRGPGVAPRVGKIPWRRKWQSTPVLLGCKVPWMEESGRLQSMGSQSQTRLSNFTDTVYAYLFKLWLSPDTCPGVGLLNPMVVLLLDFIFVLRSFHTVLQGFPGGSDCKESACKARGLGWEDPLEKDMATHFSILAWRIPWSEEPGGLQLLGSVTKSQTWLSD